MTAKNSANPEEQEEDFRSESSSESMETYKDPSNSNPSSNP